LSPHTPRTAPMCLCQDEALAKNPACVSNDSGGPHACRILVRSSIAALVDSLCKECIIPFARKYGCSGRKHIAFRLITEATERHENSIDAMRRCPEFYGKDKNKAGAKNHRVGRLSSRPGRDTDLVVKLHRCSRTLQFGLSGHSGLPALAYSNSGPAAPCRPVAF